MAGYGVPYAAPAQYGQGKGMQFTPLAHIASHNHHARS